MRARHLFPSIHAARKHLKRFLSVIRSVMLDWLCTKMEKPPTIIVPGRNSAAPSASPEPVFAPATTKTGITARRTGAARNIRPFQQTTDFPLTGNACVLSGLTPCGRSASATIPASNPQVRNDCGCVTAQVRQISTHWLISPPWRLRWPPFCMVLTPTVLPNSFGVPPDLPVPYLLQARGLSRCGFCALETPKALLIPVCLFAGSSFCLFCSSLL